MEKNFSQINKACLTNIKNLLFVKHAWLILSSVLLWVSTFPPLNFSFLIFIAFVPLFEHLENCSHWKQVIKTGFLFGFLIYTTQGYWLFSVAYKTIGNVGLSLVPWIALGLGGGFLFIVHMLLIRICFRINWLWAIPFIWVLSELFRSFMPILHFPWCLVHIPLANTPYLAQHASLGTGYLVSWWVIAINLIIFLFFRKRQTLQKLLIPLTICGSLLAYSLFRWHQPNKGLTHLKIVAAQLGINVSYTQRDIKNKLIQTLGFSVAEFAENNQADLLIFGEGIADSVVNYPPSIPFEKFPKTPFLYGAIRQEGSLAYQSALLFQNKTWSFYDKLRLVAFGEYVPFRNFLSFASTMGAPKSDLNIGLIPKLMRLGNHKFGNMICFEGLFSDISWYHAANGAQFLVIISQDDWFQGTTFLDYLKSASIYRSIETGLPLVRTTNLGYTFFTDSRGKVISEAPLNQFIPLMNRIEIPNKTDAFVYAWVFPWIVYGISLCVGMRYILCSRKI